MADDDPSYRPGKKAALACLNDKAGTPTHADLIRVNLSRRRIKITARNAVTVAQLKATVDRQFFDGMWSFGVLVALRLTDRGLRCSNAIALEKVV